MTSQNQASLAVMFCTHKRGAGLAVFEAGPDGINHSAGRACATLSSFSAALPQSSVLPLTGATQTFYKMADGNCLFAVCSGLTAENLAGLYRSALAEMNCPDSSVEIIGVVGGPGSFTGLRLGCAFANGLAMGRSRECWSVGGLPPDEFSERLKALGLTVSPEFAGGQSCEADDPFAVPVAFADLLLHLNNWARGGAVCTEVFEPVYGRDPTPVIKLRQQQGESIS